MVPKVSVITESDCICLSLSAKLSVNVIEVECRTYDLLITSSNALLLSYRRIVGTWSLNKFQ